MDFSWTHGEILFNLLNQDDNHKPVSFLGRTTFYLNGQTFRDCGLIVELPVYFEISLGVEPMGLLKREIHFGPVGTSGEYKLSKWAADYYSDMALEPVAATSEADLITFCEEIEKLEPVSSESECNKYEDSLLLYCLKEAQKTEPELIEKMNSYMELLEERKDLSIRLDELNLTIDRCADELHMVELLDGIS